MNMNQTIDCFGADNLIIHERPLTISYIDENSPQKFCNLSQLLASQNTKRTQKKCRRSLYQVTLKDYYYQTYIPTRSPPSLQLQLQNYQYNIAQGIYIYKFIQQRFFNIIYINWGLIVILNNVLSKLYNFNGEKSKWIHYNELNNNKFLQNNRNIIWINQNIQKLRYINFYLFIISIKILLSQQKLLILVHYTSKSTNSRKNKFTKQKEAKCQTLPLNDFNYDEIQKRIELKKMMLEKMYLIKDNQKTQAFKTEQREEVVQNQKLKTDLSVQSNNRQRKNQEIQTFRPAQSRIGSSYQNNRKINTFQAMPLSLGLSIEKCKIVERLTQSPFYTKTSQKKSQKNCSVGDKGQKFIMQKPIIEQFCLQKKSSIPVAKWDHSDLEND